MTSCTAGRCISSMVRIEKSTSQDGRSENERVERMQVKRASPRILCLCALLIAISPSARGQVSMYTAVDLALRNSTAVQIATAEVQRVTATLDEARDVYKPNFVLGSGLGYSYGFPLGEPSVFNVSSQSLVLSYSQPDYIRAARMGLKASTLSLKDTRQQVVLDTALDYIELDKITRQLSALDAQGTAADKLATIEQQRLDAGLEGRTELLRALLTGAQVRLKRLHIEDDAAVLREKLSHLTGLPAPSFVTAMESIPAEPSVSTADLSANLDAMGNEGVQAAYAVAKSRTYTSFGDRRQDLRPQIAFSAIYSRFSTFNNYQTYYRSFQANNLGVGISITLPLFDASRRAKARESIADALHATAQADQLRDQTSEAAMQLQKSLGELSAQEEVARLQSEISEDELQTVLTQLQSGNGGAGGARLTPKDEQQARIEQQQRYLELLDSSFELTRARLNLLRTLGDIEDWAKTSPHP
jgi:outer membrane protein TolC